jgi:peptidoglycan/xylan/chitin deacetylase (PgdA/CDA1 family)
MFERQMRWLARSADVLSEADLLYLIRTDRPMPGRCAMVTFDDGYIDNYQLAFPVLRSLNMPAIFFIPTQAIEDRSLGWWDIISYLVKRCTKERVYLESCGAGGPTRTASEKAETIRHLLSFIKRTRDRSTEDVLGDLSRACEVEPPTRAEQGSQLMTWEQLGEMLAKDMAVGSHTHSHGVLSAMGSNAQLSELRRSKQLLETRLNHEVSSLSYPVGGESHYSKATKDAARAAGYALAFSFTKRVTRRRVDDPFDITRIPPPRALSLFKAVTVAPSLFL